MSKVIGLVFPKDKPEEAEVSVDKPEEATKPEKKKK